MLKMNTDYLDDKENFRGGSVFVTLNRDDDTFYTDMTLTDEQMQAVFDTLHRLENKEV